MGTFRTTPQNTRLILWGFLPDKNNLMFYPGQKGQHWPPFKLEVSDEYEKCCVGITGGQSPLKSVSSSSRRRCCLGRTHELGCFLQSIFLLCPQHPQLFKRGGRRHVHPLYGTVVHESIQSLWECAGAHGLRSLLGSKAMAIGSLIMLG